MNLEKKNNYIMFGELIELSKFTVSINMLVECPNGDCLWAEGKSDSKRKEKISGLEIKMCHIDIGIGIGIDR